MLVKPWRVAVIGGVFWIFETLHLGVCNQNHHHSAFIPEFLKQIDDLAPVGKRVGVAPAVTAIRLFDVPDAVFAADLVKDQPFQPIGGINHHGLKIMLFIPERGQFRQHFREAVRQRELLAVDFSQTVLGLNENRSRRGCSERAIVCYDEIIGNVE